MGTQPPSFAALKKMSATQQDAALRTYFAMFPGTVTASWVAHDSKLKPYQGDSALQMYQALQSQFPNASPLTRGATVYQTWLSMGLGSAIQKISLAQAAALGSTATGVENAQYLPSGLTGLAAIGAFFNDLSQEATWERVGEGVVGLILLYVAFKGVTGVDPIAPVKKAVKTAAIFE